MMRRIDLLPESHLRRRRERRARVGVIIAGGVLLLGLIGWWLILSMNLNDARDELAAVQETNRELQAQIDELARFARLDAEVQTKIGALRTVMAGDVDWPSILTQVAQVIPGDTQLTSLQGSAGLTEGATQVGTETAAVQINPDLAFGRIAFLGRTPSMPGVARWMIRLGSVREFEAVWLNDAARSEDDAQTGAVEFDNTVELGPRAASERFLGELE